MMHQEPLEMAESMSYMSEVIAECIDLVGLCKDCLEHELDNRETKLKTLLGVLENNMLVLNDDFPYRLTAMQKLLTDLGIEIVSDQNDRLCT